MNRKLRVLLTGPYPPPAGGISIHIKRLQDLLKEDFEITIIDESSNRKTAVFNFRSLQLLKYIKMIGNSDVVFIHSGNKLFKKIHILTSKFLRKKIVITLHGYGAERSQPFKSIDSWIYGMADKIILVNNDIQNRLSLPPDKCIVKHAFLPPLMQLEPELPEHLVRWIERKRQQGCLLICANASRLDLHNNEDLYGLDMAIEVAHRLHKTSGKPAFIFNVSSLENCGELYDRYKKRIEEFQLSDRFKLINESLSFVKLIEQSDIVVRPTNADGDALTIREALFLQKMVLASDVISRPEGTVLFKTRDHDDFEVKLRNLIDSREKSPGGWESAVSVGSEDFKAFYINLLQQVSLQ